MTALRWQSKRASRQVRHSSHNYCRLSADVTPLEIPGASLLSWSPERAVLTVDTEHVLMAVNVRISEQVELVDVAIETKPMDQLIVEL